MNRIAKTPGFAAVAALSAIVALALGGYAHAGEGYSAKLVEQAPPAGLSDEIKAELGGSALQVSGPDGLRFEFWFVKSLALSGAIDEGDPLSKVPEIALIGAAKVEDVENLDFREDEVVPGVYTMRLGLQPEDGNHLGTSPYPYFAILIPADRDQKLSGVESHDDMVDRSMKDTVGIHPNILALQPLPDDAPGVGEVAEGENDWQYVVIELPGKVDGKDAPFKVALVFEGIGEL